MGADDIIEIYDRSENRVLGIINGYKTRVITKEKEGYYEIIIDNISLFEDITINKGEALNFDIADPSIRIIAMYAYECIALKKGNYPNGVVLKADFDSYAPRNRTNFTLKLLESWRLDEQKYHWSNLGPYQKRIWRNLALYYHGLEKRINNPNKTIVLDSKKIKIEEDFYCYLGELFFGYSGYMGKGLVGIDDCLCYITNKKEYTLKILNYTLFKETLTKTTKYPDYVWHILDIFEKRGLKVILD